MGAYIPPDSVVDSSRPEFTFLAGHERIKVKRLRGIVSMGLLIPAPPGARIGDNIAEYFNVTRYDPPLPLIAGGETEAAPPDYRPNYDVNTLRRFTHLFTLGEPVWITEKIHGANSRFCFAEGRMHAGSRTTWKKYNKDNLWWKCLDQHPELEAFCRAHPGMTAYGEVYGSVQNLKYGAKPGELRLAIFDLLEGSGWIDPRAALAAAPDLPWVPLIAAEIPFDLEAVLALAEGNSVVPGANHVREGIVLKPMHERTDPEIGRVCLKVVSNAYLEKA
ncbi:MAG TPA: RNA ligase family protein [Blastocatellia bacterium]|nr:RNA ligase family protein [Blastocatellia bacterium]